MRRTDILLAITACATLACSDSPTAPDVATVVSNGDAAPDFTKDVLDGGTFNLFDAIGPVVVLYLFGYSCPFCIQDGPDFETNVNQYYQDTQPGLVTVVGVDMWDGSASQVASFRSQTGATFPLLLDGSRSAGGNLSSLYGPFDNFVVIDGEGIIRYHAADLHSHGNRYHPSEIRAAVDGALATGRIGTGLRPGNADGDAAHGNVYDAAGRSVLLP